MKTYNPPPTKIGAYGEALRGYEYEVDERKAILLEESPDMNWVHALNKAKKEIAERRTQSKEFFTMSKSNSVIYEPKGAALEYSHLALNLYIGCGFACTYCYAPAIVRQNIAEWSKNPRPKKDILKRLESDAKRMAGDPRKILLCYTSDPYQNPEAAALTREALLILERYNMTVTVLTKAGMAAAQDFDILKRNNWEFGTTISVSCNQTKEEWEPGAASIQSRKEAIIKASEMDIKTWVSMEPVIDPQQALNVIDHLVDYVDFWKIGKMNHRKIDVDWVKFREDVISLLEEWGAKYYIKKELEACK